MNDEIRTLVTDLLADRVAEVVNQRGAGHCIRVDDSPLGVAQNCCSILQDRLGTTDLAVVIRTAPTEPFERPPTQVVELRNRSDFDDAGVGVLVVFVPPQERLAIEDSIGASTSIP